MKHPADLQQGYQSLCSRPAVAAGLLLCAVALGVRVWLPVAVAAATITVNSSADNAANDGQCTLREAIIAANTNTVSGAAVGECAAGSAGLDNIVFNIGAGNPTINPGSALPTITEPLNLNGNTGGATRVVIDGSGTLNVNGLTITAGSSTVQSLVVNHFNGGSGVVLSGSGGNVVKDCFLGTNAAGAAAAFNTTGITIDTSPNNLIGGTAAGSRNVISGNSGPGISLSDFGAASTGNQIQGNYVGLAADGSTVLGNNPGIQISNGIINNTIGGTTVGARNVISGNQTGISISAGAAGSISGITIQGNYIGTDTTGTLDRGNSQHGILILGGTTNLTIGGVTAGAGNVISGNDNYGIRLQGNGAAGAPSNTTIQGNFIGPNAAGTASLGNAFEGIRIDNSSNNTIGGATAAARNIISGNGGNGILVFADFGQGSSDQIAGNFIGTDVTGSVDLGNALAGIRLASVSNNTVGGTAAGAGNLISGNDQYGIRIDSPGQLATSNVVQGNLIGTKADGTTALGNTLAGVTIGFGNNNTIGGSTNGAGNTIAFNTTQGVQVSNGTGNAILSNSIFSNEALGIDLGFTGVTGNDNCDVDTGANNLQNFPAVTAATTTSGQIQIQGTLNSTAATTLRVEFFTNDSCDPAGNGEGKLFLGSTSVTTDANCNAAINVTLPVAVAAGQQLTATATDSNGNTSEFSSCGLVAGAPPTVQFSAANYNVNEGCLAKTITVTRTGDTGPAVTVDWATGDGSAQQRTDYTIGSGTLNFAAGVTSQTFPVLVCKDAYAEGNENIGLTLSNPTGGAALGSPGVASLTIIDDPTVPINTQPLDDAQNFVCEHYHDFLSRDPDSGGLTFWVNSITQCGSDQTCVRNKRIDVSNAFFYELEFQQTGSYAFRLYRAAFGNNQPFPNPDNSNQAEASKLPNYAVFSRDRARVVGGADLAQGQQSLANAFVQRPEFVAKYATNLTGQQFIDAVLATIQSGSGVNLQSQSAALLVLFNQAGGGSAGRGVVLYRLANDDVQGGNGGLNNRSFIDAEYNRAFVATQYFGYLRRDADIGGFLFWLGQVNGAPLRDVTRQHAMVCSFTTSIEYQQRFSAVVTHSNSECPQ